MRLPPNKQRRMTHLLGEDVIAWINARIAEGLGFREVAEELQEKTGVPITRQTIHNWVNKEKLAKGEK